MTPEFDDAQRVAREDDYLRDATVLLDGREVLVVDADPTGSGDAEYIRARRRERLWKLEEGDA